MSDSDEDTTLHRYVGVPPRTVHTGREMSPMSVQSFSHSSRMQYPSLYAQNTRELAYNKRCRSPMSVRSYGQWGYNNRCMSTMSVRSNDSNVSALDIQFALNDIRKYNKHDLKIIKNSIYNAYKQIKNYDRWRIAKRKKIKSYFKKYRRTSDSADDGDDNRNGESGADGSDSSISDDCRSTRSAFNARHIPRSRARRHNGVGAMKMDLNMMTEQVRDSENYRDCTANIKQRTLRNSLSHTRTFHDSLAPRHNQQKITHDIRNAQLSENGPISMKDRFDSRNAQLIENGSVSMKDRFDTRNAQLSESVPNSRNDRFVKDTSMPCQRFNKNIPNQQNVTHDSRNIQLSETQNDKLGEPQNGSISLKERFTKDTSMLLPCQRFNNKNVTYKVSYTQKKTTAHQEQSTYINTYGEDNLPQDSSTVRLKGSDTSSLQQRRVLGNNRNDDNEDEQIFSRSKPTQSNINTLNQKRILDNHDSPETKRAKLLNLPENKTNDALPKRGVMKKLTTNNNGFKKPSGINKKTVLSGLDQFWKTDLESEEDGPVISSSEKCLQKDKHQQKNRENNKDDFNFKKPQAPISKLGTVMRHNQSDVLIAKSTQPLTGNVEPTFNQVKQNPHSATNHEKKETTTEHIIHKQTTQNHSDTVISNTMADSTHNSTDVSMIPSFSKRKLFTQTLDMAQDTNISSDNMNSPQTKTLRTCREKNRVRKLTSQSCLSRDITSDSNYLDLIHKIVPPEQLKNQNVNNSNINKKKTSKIIQEKQGKWDVSSALSTCDDDPKSDTYTDEEIFNMPQENNKVKPIKEVTDKKPKKDAPQSQQSEPHCKVVVQKLTLLETKKKETSPKRGVRKKLITNNNDVNFKKPGLTKKSALSALGTFWDTDFTDEEDSMIYSARTTQRSQQENKENEHESPNRCTGSTRNTSPNKVLKNNNNDANRVTKNQIDNKATKKNSKKENSKKEIPKAANAKSTKNNDQSQSTLNTSRESLRLKEKKQSKEARLPDKNHKTESPSVKLNTSRQSLRIKQKKLANSFTTGTSSHIDNKPTKKNSKQVNPKSKTLSQSTFNISRESLRKSCLTDKNHNVEPVSNKRGKLTETPIRIAKLNCIGYIRTNKVK